jgi:hypothetical protein
MLLAHATMVKGNSRVLVLSKSSVSRASIRLHCAKTTKQRTPITECIFIASCPVIGHHHSSAKMLIIQCLSPKSSPMAKSRKNPGCLRPIIASVQYRDGVPPPGIFWRGFAGGRLEGCGAVLLDRYICVTDAQVLEIWANAIAHIPQWWWVVPRRVGATLHGGTHGIAEGCTVAL